jgi:tripartite-type tricarboxylate transporter receptor subunit TctC
MTKTLGRVIIIENKPGASGNIAAQFVLGAPADGNVILVGTQAMFEISPNAHEGLKWSLNDFIPLIRGVVAPLVLVTNSSVPAKTLMELVGWIKRNPGKLSYSSYTAGTPSHFLGFQMNRRFGLDLAHVPYRGSGPQTTDLVAGHALLGFTQIQSALPYISDQKLNAIATTGAARSRLLPDVPTFADLGFAEFTTNIWFGLFVRADTPRAVVTSRLNAAIWAHADPDVKSKLEAQGFDISGQFGPELTFEIKRELERWAPLIKASGFKFDSSQ